MQRSEIAAFPLSNLLRELLKTLDWQRTREEIALIGRAACFGEEASLFRSFDAFCNHAEAEVGMRT